VALERLRFPEPVVTRVVEPRTAADRERLRAALERLSFEDPTFTIREDEETGQWLIAGMGELHLEIKEHRLRDDFHLEVQVGQPRVAYREALLAAARGPGRVDRPLFGKAGFGAVRGGRGRARAEAGCGGARPRLGPGGGRRLRPGLPGPGAFPSHRGRGPDPGSVVGTPLRLPRGRRAPLGHRRGLGARARRRAGL